MRATLYWLIPLVFVLLGLYQRNHFLDMAERVHPGSVSYNLGRTALAAEIDAFCAEPTCVPCAESFVQRSLDVELHHFLAAPISDALKNTTNTTQTCQWSPTSQRRPTCLPSNDAWDTIATASAALKTWQGTFVYGGSPLYEGRILTREFHGIDKVVHSIRKNHTECALSPTQRLYQTGTEGEGQNFYRRLVCACARESDNSNGSIRERKTRTQRTSDHSETCPVCINLIWDSNIRAWKVGKLVTEHRTHFARLHREAELSDEQRDRFGTSLVDANLSADQVKRAASAVHTDPEDNSIQDFE
jgi:hypothetical protein